MNTGLFLLTRLWLGGFRLRGDEVLLHLVRVYQARLFPVGLVDVVEGGTLFDSNEIC